MGHCRAVTVQIKQSVGAGRTLADCLSIKQNNSIANSCSFNPMTAGQQLQVSITLCHRFKCRFSTRVHAVSSMSICQNFTLMLNDVYLLEDRRGKNTLKVCNTGNKRLFTNVAKFYKNSHKMPFAAERRCYASFTGLCYEIVSRLLRLILKNTSLRSRQLPYGVHDDCMQSQPRTQQYVLDRQKSSSGRMIYHLFPVWTNHDYHALILVLIFSSYGPSLVHR